MSSACEDSDYIGDAKNENKSRTKRRRKKRRIHSHENHPGGSEENVKGRSTRSPSHLVTGEHVGQGETTNSLPMEWQPAVEASPEETAIESDINGRPIRPLTDSERLSALQHLSLNPNPSPFERIVAHKLRSKKAANTSVDPTNPLTILDSVAPRISSDSEETITALEGIQSTPFESSFLSRLSHVSAPHPPGLIQMDWDIRTPWMDLMDDIREHYTLSHPDRDVPPREIAPLTYTTLQPEQLPQINDLLQRSFWSGIDVTDSLDYSPERSTVVALYKKVVVGVAIIASPRETYVMYLAVKSGWDKSGIARTMLYHIIQLNPGMDITLHVSANNSAMLLYNEFGFKAEGFIFDFYAQYLDPNSRASKNALLLRLRQH